VSAVTAVAGSVPSMQPLPEAPKLAKAAQEFEAVLLSHWLEKMQQTFSNSDQSGDPAHDTLASIGTQAVASALAARGGIGIGNMLRRQCRGSAGSAAEAARPSATSSQNTEPRAVTSHIKAFLEPADISNINRIPR
jgi:Rod binding domain-containing protein